MSRQLDLYDFVENIETHQRGRIIRLTCSACHVELDTAKAIVAHQKDHAPEPAEVLAEVKLFVGVEITPAAKLELVK